MYRPVCELDDEHRTAVFDSDLNPRKRQKMRPPNGDLIFWCSSGDSNPVTAACAAITFYPLRSKTLRVWCPGFERAKPRKEKTDRTRRSVFSFGAPAGIRTPDTLLKRQVLCLLSYWGAGARTSRGAALTYWLGWRDSNPLYRSQSPVCYHYTTSQDFYERGLTACGRGPLSGGVGYGARTHDTRNHNPVLCQLS